MFLTTDYTDNFSHLQIISFEKKKAVYTASVITTWLQNANDAYIAVVI